MKVKVIIATISVLLSLPGAYGFATEGVENPIVWALSGSLAPFLWLSLTGLTLLAVLFLRASISEEGQLKNDCESTT